MVYVFVLQDYTNVMTSQNLDYNVRDEMEMVCMFMKDRVFKIGMKEKLRNQMTLKDIS